MPVTDFSVNKVQAWAVINGEEIELSRVELRYYLNTIPEATLQCAIGRDVRSLEVAPIHEIIGDLKVQTPVTVYCQADEAANSGVTGGDWPSDPFIIFDGVIVGTGSRKAREGTANLVLSCRSNLVGLEYSWAPNKMMHPLNAGNFHMAAGLNLGDDNPSFIISTLASQFFTSTTVENDYWSLGLQPWLTAIANQRQIFDNDAIDQGNNDAIAALNLFEPFVDDGSEQLFGVPLSMNNFDIIGTRPGIDSLVTDAANETARSFTGTTFWEKIVQDFGSRYLFTLVPMATRALIVPMIPGLTQAWLTIDPDEYDSISLSGFLPRPLRGVVLYTGVNSMTGAFGLQRGHALDIQHIGGLFENTNMQEGMLYFRDAPQWLSNAVSQMCWAPGAAAPNAVKGNVAAGPAGEAPDFPPAMALRDQAKTLWDEYAKALYLFEVFKHRNGTVVGKLRFDIAPGSTIDLITIEEKFVDQTVAFPSDLVLNGIVTGVTVMIDSEACRAYTAIEMRYMRDVIERIDPNLTTDAHPLWSVPFAGAPLCKEFGPEPPPADENDQ